MERPPSSVLPPLRGCTNAKLRRTLRLVARHYDAELERAGLRTTQYSLLTQLRRMGPVRPGALAAAMLMDASTLSRDLKPLLAAGWVSAGPGPDGRSRTVCLTETGQAKQAEARRRWRIAQDALTRTLGEEDVRALHALLDGAVDRLIAAPETR